MDAICPADFTRWRETSNKVTGEKARRPERKPSAFIDHPKPSEVTIPEPVTTTREPCVDVLPRGNSTTRNNGLKTYKWRHCQFFRSCHERTARLFSPSKPNNIEFIGRNTTKLKSPATNNSSYDVVIIGGALAGGATATLLLREKPDLKVLIIEKSSTFGRRVGEATVEVSAYFLGHQLGLTQHLNECHLLKQGLRFWFFNEQSKSLDQCSEIGGRYLPRVPAYQVDRAVLDEELLRRVSKQAELWRPAQVTDVKLIEGGMQTISVTYNEQKHEIQARWVVDASGVAALLARRNGWWRANTEHPTTAVWSRWKGVKDWDGLDLAQKFPKWHAACRGIRGTATNHLIGEGWWAWIIPLKGGDVSIGAVFDQRLVDWTSGGSIGGQLKEFLCAHPVGKELLADAQFAEGDVHWRKNLPYYSTVFAGDGFALVGDAAGFIDPFYSPGMDWIGYTTSAAAKMILKERVGESVAPLLQQHNKDFSLCYHRWFRALYLNKYEYMGDFELMKIAFVMDVALYYLGVASQPFRKGAEAFLKPVFSEMESVPFYHFIRFYNARLSHIARSRRARGTWGQRNHDQQFLFNGFNFGAMMLIPIAKVFLKWMRLELTEGWRSWWPKPVPVKETGPRLAQ